MDVLLLIVLVGLSLNAAAFVTRTFKGVRWEIVTGALAVSAVGLVVAGCWIAVFATMFLDWRI